MTGVQLPWSTNRLKNADAPRAITDISPVSARTWPPNRTNCVGHVRRDWPQLCGASWERGCSSSLINRYFFNFTHSELKPFQKGQSGNPGGRQNRRGGKGAGMDEMQRLSTEEEEATLKRLWGMS